MKILTGAEYKKLRQHCGLNIIDCMEFHGVKNRRTIERWESGYSEISEQASEKILSLHQRLLAMKEQYLSVIKRQIKKMGGRKPEDLVLITYSPRDSDMIFGWTLPFNCHSGLVGMIFTDLKNMGIDVRLVPMNRKKYFAFLEERNLSDTPSARAAWGGLQI